jgi:hypothetical protein
VPAEHSPEQQPAFEEHLLPMVAHVALSAVHVPPVPQDWLQHWAFVAQGRLSDWHAG